MIKILKSILINIILSLIFVAPILGYTKEDISILQPPVINFYKKNISNDELFYISGVTAVPKADVIIYFQKEDSSLLSQTVKSDDFGRWFYTYPTFLSKGKYAIWTQLKADALTSPPSSQINIEVDSTALQVGSRRIGFGALSVILALFLLAFITFLLVFIIYHFKRHNRKNKILNKEIAKTEAMVHYGFVALRKDILAELSLLGSGEEEKKLKILKDLEFIEKKIERELKIISK